MSTEVPEDNDDLSTGEPDVSETNPDAAPIEAPAFPPVPLSSDPQNADIRPADPLAPALGANTPPEPPVAPEDLPSWMKP